MVRTGDDGVPEPRAAATVLLLRDDPFQVLMVRRRRGGVFSNALVFPGGVIEPSDADDAWLPLLTGAASLDPDARAARVGGVRETFEEASILVARLPDGSPITPGPPDDGSDFLELVRRRGAVLPLDELHPAGRWITPVGEPRRFDAQFLLCRAPEGQLARQDDGETVGFEWAAPQQVLDRAAAGERDILFPTLMNLRRLAESGTVDQAMAAADARPSIVVEPVLRREGGRAIVTIPAELGFGVTEHVVAQT
ncbi:MAG TPA: NUDIX hydrolase [Pseudolysinimonas sp.]|jgi:8-oxo-dGTP pyrophosphatase MutT (NUDIX family)